MIHPVLIVGGGGHTKVLIEAIRLCSIPILGILDADPTKVGTEISGVRVIGNDDMISEYDPKKVALINGIGSIHHPKSRMTAFNKFKGRGFTFAVVVHPSTIVASDVVIGEGSQIMAGAVIQPGVTIGADTIVNTRVSIDHDCVIGDNVHIAPGVTLSGSVKVGDGVHIGTGATVIQSVTIGSNSVVGAGSVVVDNVPDDAEVFGVPAKPKKNSLMGD